MRLWIIVDNFCDFLDNLSFLTWTSIHFAAAAQKNSPDLSTHPLFTDNSIHKKKYGYPQRFALERLAFSFDFLYNDSTLSKKKADLKRVIHNSTQSITISTNK